MTYKNTFFSLIMMVVVGLAAWTSLLSLRPQNIAAAQTSMLPDAIMEGVNAVIMDKQGKPSMKIVTPRMVHYTDNDTSHLTSPRLTIYRKSPKPWIITADYALASKGVEDILFKKNVTIHHPADMNNPSTLIKTPSLIVHPNAQTAETNELITLIQPSMTVKATGMYADMNSGDIKLLSQARGEYVPSS
jgi:lipopolysaccharide export system protein LptC